MKKILIALFFLCALPAFSSTVKNYVLIDVDRQEIIDGKGAQDVAPLASITKLMTVLVTLHSGADLYEKVTVTGQEHSHRIRVGQRMRRIDLIQLALVASDNLAARTLSETTFSSYSSFIFAMNRAADNIGMSNTNFIEPTGLSVFNVSTPWDVYLLTKETSKHPIFSEAAMTKVVEVYTEIKNKVKKVFGRNTNSFAGLLKIQSAKTGFTSPAGRCLTMLIEQDGKQYAVVVMGAKTPVDRQQTVQSLIVEYNKRVS